MPHVINGIGTWYSGKRHIATRRAACAHCGAIGDLRSYDTTKFFVVVFIPIIPLQRLHIVDECPACRKHLAVPLARWHKRRDDELALTLESLQDRPDDPAAATVAIGTAVNFRDEQAFLGFAGLIPSRHGGDATVQAALGEAYDFFGHADSAIDAYRRSLAIKPDAELEIDLGVALLRYGRVDEGRPLVSRVIGDGTDRGRGIGYLTVEALAARGRHQEALDVLAHMEAADPVVKRGPYLKRYRRQSTQRLKSGAPVHSSAISLGAKPQSAPPRDSRWAAKIPWLIGPALLIFGIIVWCVIAVDKGKSRVVYVVNGHSLPYQVQIGPQQVHIEPRQVTPIALPEGDHVVKVLTPEANIADQTCTLRTSFWRRPIDRKTIVINPDQLAVLVWTESEYVPQNSGRTPAMAMEIRTPALLHDYYDIDYVMQPFPHSLTLSGSRPVTRRQIDWYEGTVDQALAGLGSELGLEAMLALARRGVSCDPAVEDYAAMLRLNGHASETVSLLRPHLARRPINLATHRAYQDAAEQVGDLDALAAEYTAMLKAEPDSPVIKYLTGRAIDNQAESRRLFMEAKSAPEAIEFASGALAFDAHSVGDFARALEFVRAALPSCPTSRRLRYLELECLHALGRIDECLQTPDLQHPPENATAAQIIDRVCFLARAGQQDQIEGLLDQFAGPESGHIPDDPAYTWRAWVRDTVAYVQGDPSQLINAGKSEHPFRVDSQIVAGEYDAAAKRLAEIDPVSAEQPLTLALAAGRAGKSAIADAALAQAVSILNRGGYSERRAAAWLAGTTTPAAGEVTDAVIDFDTKRIALALLATRYPERRQECIDLLKKLNYDRRPPYLLLKQVIESPAP